MSELYDFERFQPPVVTEKNLRKELERRELRKQITLLRAASLIVVAAMVLFAFFIINDSVLCSVLLIVAACISVVGNGIISVVFYFTGNRTRCE